MRLPRMGAFFTFRPALFCFCVEPSVVFFLPLVSGRFLFLKKAVGTAVFASCF